MFKEHKTNALSSNKRILTKLHLVLAPKNQKNALASRIHGQDTQEVGSLQYEVTIQKKNRIPKLKDRKSEEYCWWLFHRFSPWTPPFAFKKKRFLNRFQGECWCLNASPNLKLLENAPRQALRCLPCFFWPILFVLLPDRCYVSCFGSICTWSVPRVSFALFPV